MAVVWIRFADGFGLITPWSLRQELSNTNSCPCKIVSLSAEGKEKVPSKLKLTQAQKTGGGSSLRGFWALSPPFAEKLEGSSLNLFHHILSHCFQPTPTLCFGILHHTHQGMKSLQLMETSMEFKNWAPFWWAAFAFKLSCDLGYYHLHSANTE